MPVVQLEIREKFEKLSKEEKLYAHHMSRAAWLGTRIIMRQVSPESIPILDLIMELYKQCDGNWFELSRRTGAEDTEMTSFLLYASIFLANVGNYFGSGDQKILPRMTDEFMVKICSSSDKATELLEQVRPAMLSRMPCSLGFPSDITQSAYYPGNLRMSREEIEEVSTAMEENSILAENTRILKVADGEYDVLIASIESDTGPPRTIQGSKTDAKIRIVRGDHSRELDRICMSLKEAQKYAANERQKEMIDKYIESFKTGDMETYKESQRIWVRDKKPTVETCFGFVEPYRDPMNIRAEFEGIVAILDQDETQILTRLVDDSTRFIKKLPWAEDQPSDINDGKGPFEKELFEPPDFTSIHALAYCSSIIFPGINIPNFNDIRQTVGFKNVMVQNRMAIDSMHVKSSRPPPHIDASEAATYKEHYNATFFLWVVFHELLGHGTGKLLSEEADGSYNFDIKNPPVNPLTGKPIETWYKQGQTWNGLFGDIATSVDECRAECVGAYLMSDRDIVALFGYTEESDIKPADLEYNMYLQLGETGLRALADYNIESKHWGQAHSRGHFAMFNAILAVSDGFLTIEHDDINDTLTAHIDRSKIHTHGRKAIRDMLLRLHIYRCTADVKGCREYYENLTKVEEKHLEWRAIVVHPKNNRGGKILLQANTFLGDDGEVTLKEYDLTLEGVIQSWYDRDV